MWNSFLRTKGTILIKSIKVTASMGIDHPKTQKTQKPRTKVTLSRSIFVRVSLLALLFQRNLTPQYYMNLLEAHHHWVTEFLWNSFVKELWKKLSVRVTRVLADPDFGSWATKHLTNRTTSRQMMLTLIPTPRASAIISNSEDPRREDHQDIVHQQWPLIIWWNPRAWLLCWARKPRKNSGTPDFKIRKMGNL